MCRFFFETLMSMHVTSKKRAIETFNKSLKGKKKSNNMVLKLPAQ